MPKQKVQRSKSPEDHETQEMPTTVSVGAVQITETILVPQARAKGNDTCARLNVDLRYSGILLYTYVDGIGYVRVLAVKQATKDMAKLFYVDGITGEENSAFIPWSKEFSLFLGEP